MSEIIEWSFFMWILFSTVSSAVRNIVTVIVGVAVSIFSYISIFLFCQMVSGPREVWCLPAGVLESMEVLAPPSG